MLIIDNINKTVKEDLQAGIQKGSKMSAAAACFSFTNSRNQKKEGTKNHELINLATAADFTEDDIRNRTSQIMTAFLTFLSENSLTK